VKAGRYNWGMRRFWDAHTPDRGLAGSGNGYD
jgi:hypothetical protein